MPEEVRPDLARLDRCGVDAFAAVAQQSGKVGLAEREREAAEVVAVSGEHVEGVELHLVIAPAAVQGVEIGVAADAEHRSLAVEHEALLADLLRRVDDPAWASAALSYVNLREHHLQRATAR